MAKKKAAKKKIRILTKEEKGEIWSVSDACGFEDTFDMFKGTKHEELFKRLKKDYQKALSLVRSFEEFAGDEEHEDADLFDDEYGTISDDYDDDDDFDDDEDIW